jgi:Flp pilus assembly protein protease CpaA
VPIFQPHNLMALMVISIATAAAMSDYRTGLIPNSLVGIGCVGLVVARALLAGFLRGPSQVGGALLASLLGGLATGLVPLALYGCSGMGGGDVKLLATIGVGLGPAVGFEAELYAFGLGALYALACSAQQGTLRHALRGSTLLLSNPLLPRRLQVPVPETALTPLRFGPAICAGAVVAVALHVGSP